jgi:hypothetical protein
MKLYKILTIFMAVFMAGVLLVGCHDGGTITTDTGSGGGEDIEIGEDSFFSSAAPSEFGRGVTLSFSAPIPEASVSAKADEVTLTRDQFEAMLVIKGPASVIVRPERFAWAEDGSSVSIWGAFRYCKSYDFILGDEMVSVSMNGNHGDFNFSDLCAADFPLMDRINNTFNVFMDGEILDLGQVTISSLVADSPWQYGASDLQTKILYSVAGASPDGGAVYSSQNNDGSELYSWYEFEGSTDPDASVVVVPEPLISFNPPRGVGDVNGDGIVDICIDEREVISDNTAVTHMSIIWSVDEIGLNVSIDGLADVLIDAGDPELEGLITRLASLKPMGDIDGDGHDDVVFKKEGKLATNLTVPSELLIYSGAEVSQGETSDYSWRIINDDLLGSFQSTTGGDVNCDGISDIVAAGVRSVWNDVDDEFEWSDQKVFIFFGRADFPEFSPSSAASVVLTTEQVFKGSIDLIVLGDVNADGCDDFFGGVVTQDGGRPAGALVAGRPVWPESMDMEEAAIAGFLPGSGYDGVGVMNSGLSRTGDLDNDGYDDFALECRTASPYYAIFEGGNLSGEYDCTNASTLIDVNN